VKRLAMIVTVSIGAVTMMTAVPAGASAQVYWRSLRNRSVHNPRKDVVRPRYHSLLSDIKFRTMQWSWWGPRTAKAHGNYVVTDYYLHPHNGTNDWVRPARFELSRVRTCPDGTKIFSRLVIRLAPGSRWSAPVTYDCRGRSRSEGTVF
jgi:hypothetical protein